MDNRKETIIAALKDKDEAVRKAASDALEKLEIRERIDHLARKIESGEMLEKIKGIYAFNGMKGPKVTEILVRAARDPSEDVRAAAVRVLANMSDPSAMQQLAEALKDTSPIVVRCAIDALAPYKDPRLLGPFMQALKHADRGVVERAIEAVGNIGDKRSEEAMVYFAVKGNPRMKGLAIKALGEMDR
ncbi:MAG: HEAT repeat domain-containing protein [Deltaproteobacteria bacterium]|nr:HEAT repeat domain-containing protein [Deltaproteobacteria bacterium]